MPDPRPFVIIAATRRTGSTLLAEALTELPHAFIFREPRLFRGRVDLKPADVERLRAATGVDLDGTDPRASDAPHAARRFSGEVAAPLLQRIGQLGIKEIGYGAQWRGVLSEIGAIGRLRVVALGRDPRDIYLSLAHRTRVRRIRVPGPFGPDSVAADMRAQFAVQRQIVEATGAMTVRYEDLCTDPAVLAAIRAHVESPVRGTGIVGEFKPRNREVHGHRITDLRVRRWTRETDAGLLGDAHAAMRQLDAYCDYWGYSPE
jgi:hypothetical protein